MKKYFFFFIFFLSLCSSAQNYQDSIRELRVLHFAELMDTSNHILTQNEIDHFEGLDYFLIDTSYIINAHFIKKKGKRFKMPTTTDRQPVYRQFGFIEFSLNNSNYRLTVYQNMKLIKQKEYKNYLFLPFKDKTSGNESYGGGRYLDLRIPEENEMILDFNVCYNPYCAYSVRFSCPIPPKENTLRTEIRAGEKTPKGH